MGIAELCFVLLLLCFGLIDYDRFDYKLIVVIDF